ncbi:TPA: PIG-L deacetylase family protein, partial [Escherichia coli]
GTADRNRSHWSTSKTPSYTKSVSWQHHPDVEIMRVYTMHDADRHQDHLAVYQASMVACRTIPQILGYETPSTWLSFMPQVFESVKEEYFTVKLAALKKHKSQERRDYMRHDRLRAVAQFRGQQVNSDLGEGFVIHKMIL